MGRIVGIRNGFIRIGVSPTLRYNWSSKGSEEISIFFKSQIYGNSVEHLMIGKYLIILKLTSTAWKNAFGKKLASKSHRSPLL